MDTKDLSRRDLLRRGAAVGVLAGATTALPAVAQAHGRHGEGHEHDGGGDLEKIHALESTFHEARSLQDIDLLMSLWAPDAVFDFAGTPHSGTDEIRAFFLGSGSFVDGPRMAFAPTFKSSIHLHGRRARIYFECHDVDLATGEMVTHLFAAGTVRKDGRTWRFWRIFGGLAPLSVDHIYWP